MLVMLHNPDGVVVHACAFCADCRLRTACWKPHFKRCAIQRVGCVQSTRKRIKLLAAAAAIGKNLTNGTGPYVGPVQKQRYAPYVVLQVNMSMCHMWSSR